MHDAPDIVRRVNAMRLRARERDARHRDILAIRRGDYNAIAPGLLPEEFDKPLVANLIDTAAHDLSEVMAPLPSISCASSSQTSDVAKKFAERRSLIANSYLQRSRLSEQMYLGADRYGSFGYMAYIVEPDYAEDAPCVRVDTSLTSYFTSDYRGRIAQHASVFSIHADELCHLYPDYAQAIKNKVEYQDSKEVTIIEWRDKDATVVVCEDIDLALETIPNPLGRTLVRMVKRPTIDPREERGQFDDVIWLQIARALVASYTMSALDQSVNAPIVLPEDANELEFGPYSTIRTKTPQGVGRLPLNISPGLFPEMQALAQEQRVGSRYPEGRSGNIDASIITGQGVQALMGTFDTQVQTFQHLNETALEDVVGMCFELDQKLWPNKEKSIRVRDAGSPTSITYTPTKDIKGDFSADVSYGAVAGLDPNRSLIFLLQAVSGGFISRETGRKYLPVELDAVAEERRMDQEAFRASLVSSVASLAQAIPQMAASGQDPRQVVMQLAEVIRLHDKGKPIETAVADVFAPKPDKQEQQAPPPDALAALMGGGQPPGGAPTPPGGGQAQIEGPKSPGQDLLMSLAGMTPGGQANLQSNVSRREPAK